MSLRLWFRLFLIFAGAEFFLVGILLISLIEWLGWGNWGSLFTIQYMNINLFTLLLALSLAGSLIFSVVLTYILSQPYEQLRTKIAWLNQGKYSHTIFDQNDPISWYDNQESLNQEIEELRQRLIRQSKDLQEVHAAPVFVGEETRDEIIEQERLRIARELHDSVSQQLFAAMMLVSATQATLNQTENLQLAQQIQRIDQVIGKAQTEMRALLLHLRPIELNDKKLSEGIRQLLRELDGKIPVAISYELDDTIQLDSGIEDHLFRICQEAVSNTLRHADANRLEVYLNQTESGVSMRIIDDGKGFNLETVSSVGNYGLLNMRERIGSLGGKLTVQSVPGTGTRIDMTIPIRI